MLLAAILGAWRATVNIVGTNDKRCFLAAAYRLVLPFMVNSMGMVAFREHYASNSKGVARPSLQTCICASIKLPLERNARIS
jgi:hypothetical protein